MQEGMKESYFYLVLLLLEWKHIIQKFMWHSSHWAVLGFSVCGGQAASGMLLIQHNISRIKLQFKKTTNNKNPAGSED